MNKVKILLHPPINGDWAGINQALDEERPDICVVLGGFGYQPKLETRGLPYPTPESYWYMSDAISTSAMILFIDGPVDDFDELESRGCRNKNAILIYERCFYIPRGVIMQIQTGHNILFMGGSYPDIRDHEIHRAEESSGEVGDVDIILSYDRPKYFPSFPRVKRWYSGRKMTSYKILELQGRRTYEQIRFRHRD